MDNNNNIMKHRVIYTTEVIGISENDLSYTYTAENVMVGTLYEIGVYLRTIGVDTKMLEDFEAGNIQNNQEWEEILI